MFTLPTHTRTYNEKKKMKLWQEFDCYKQRSWAGETAQWIQVSVAVTDGPSPIPWTMVRENLLLEVVLMGHSGMYTPTHI